MSLWEIFSLFEFVNMRQAKMAYEPQRYHYVMFEHFYKTMTASDYRQDMLGQDNPKDDGKKSKKDKKKVEEEDALSVEQTSQKPPSAASSAKSSSSSSSGSSSDSDSDGSLCKSEREHRRLKRRDAKLAKLSYQ